MHKLFVPTSLEDKHREVVLRKNYTRHLHKRTVNPFWGLMVLKKGSTMQGDANLQKYH